MKQTKLQRPVGEVGLRLEKSPRLIFVTQLLDSSDPLLGFTSRWMQVLSTRCEDLVVVANEVRDDPPHLGIEVASLGKERGAGKFVRGLRYELTLGKLLRSRRPDALVAHMCPIYLNLAVPLARLFSVPTFLWFAHPSNDLSLRIAERLADGILTSFPGAFPGRSAKVFAIGQGIDTALFAYRPPEPADHGLRLIALGRTSPAKGYPTVIKAVSLLDGQGMDVRLRIVGPSSNPAEVRHRRELEELIASLSLQDRVQIEDGVQHSLVPELLGNSHALINTMVSGSADKVVLEAMASGRPAIVSNPVFAPLLDGLPLRLTFREGDAQGLAARVRELAGAGDGTLGDLGIELRKRVERNHSLEHWADEVVRIVASRRRSY